MIAPTIAPMLMTCSPGRPIVPPMPSFAQAQRGEDAVDHRGDERVAERPDQRGESRSNDDGDCQIDNVAAQNEIAGIP